MNNAPSRRLGRGLEALLGEYSSDQAMSDEANATPHQKLVPLAFLRPNQRNPRRDFSSDDLDELAASLREHGLVQPIVVRVVDGEEEQYEIIAGERRWRAAQMIGLHDVPIVVLDVSDSKALELAIVENVQRADLNAVEEAAGYDALMKEFSYTQADLGRTIGKSRAHVANMLRLLTLPESVLRRIRDGQLTAGHARTLVTANDPEALASLIVSKELSVREAERLAQLPTTDLDVKRKRIKPSKDADTRRLERNLSEKIDAKLVIDHKPGGSGEIRIRYKKLEDLDRLCEILGK